MGVQGSQAGGQEGKRMSNQKYRNLEIQISIEVLKFSVETKCQLEIQALNSLLTIPLSVDCEAWSKSA